MNKSSYALTKDTIIGCAWFCNSLCPPKTEQKPCFPTPLCGDRHTEQTRFDVRQTSAPQEETLTSLIPGNVVEMIHSEHVVGSYKNNQDIPYCCWVTCDCKGQYYDTIEVGGQRMAKITMPSCTCQPQHHVFDSTDKQIGILKYTNQCCCCRPYFSVQDQTGTELYGIRPNKNYQFGEFCFGHKYYQISDPKQQLLSDIATKSFSTVSCCHYRKSVDVTMPPKATSRDKVLLLASGYIFKGA